MFYIYIFILTCNILIHTSTCPVPALAQNISNKKTTYIACAGFYPWQKNKGTVSMKISYFFSTDRK